ncbi:MAG: HAMP domain-containing histidine kinase [Bacteroidetes bacterium]|nr:HAMP domain-containing histidine kinase [Bacteroidota bacterium]MBS1649126.1 HAMP domain-containing histidine kinase [Bacteroidota bacterium]
MKLFAKYNRINLAATIIVFLLAAIAFYFSLQYVLINQLDDSLETEQAEIEKYVAEHQKLPEVFAIKDQQIVFTATTSNNIVKKHFKSIALVDSIEKNKEFFRQLTFTIQVQNNFYTAQVSKSLEGTDDIIQSVVIITFLTILLILLVSYFINRVVLQKLWKPFYTTLHAVNNFEISKQKQITFQSNNIEEFSSLNKTLEKVINKAQQDFTSLKHFTENASHELQTPLAIIRTKLDLLIQNENLSQQQTEAIQSANNALQRLANLNKSLLLLTKIENNQYEQKININLKAIIQTKLIQLNELIQNKNIQVGVNLEEVNINMNNDLVEILLNNLLINAIKYNTQGGKIIINLTSTQLQIANTAQTSLDTTKVFTRFYKVEQSTQSNGLGLSIAKQICDTAGYPLSYSFNNNFHYFTVTF